MTTQALLEQNSLKELEELKVKPLSQRLKDIKAFGVQSMAYSALSLGIQEFRHPAFQGFIPYFSVWGIDYVLSDPITLQEDFIRATLLFLNKSKSAVFCQISEHYAKNLSSLGFTINGLGAEHIVNFDDFDVTWKRRKRLKGYLSSLSKQGFQVMEHQERRDDIEDINSQWLRTKSRGRELRFMARPFAGISENDVRYFYLMKENKILGYASFDPMYSHQADQRIVSYGLQHLRVSDQAPSGAQDFLLLNALFQFKQEGFKEISLGLSPLHHRDNNQFNYSRFAQSLFSFFYRMNLLYNYRTMGEHKEQYKAQKRPTYVACREGFSLINLSGLMKVNNLI